jgi:hypothetical protein
MGKTPPARGPLGPTRRVRTEGQGRPRGVAMAGAQRQEMTWVDASVEALLVTRPEATVRWPQPRCVDRGDDAEVGRETLAAWGATAPSRRRGEARPAKGERPGDQVRRWEVEQTPSWMNRGRRWLSRGAKQVENALAWLPGACA